MALNYNKWDAIVVNDSDDDSVDIHSKREDNIIKQHSLDIADTKMRFYSNKNTNNHQFIQSLIDLKSANHACTKSLNELNQISLWQLKPNTIHYGFKLICKIITEPDKILSFRTIIKDITNNNTNHKNTLMELSIYNLVPFKISLSHIQQKKILCKNTLIAIKEPYCKFYKSKKLGIRIDNPYYNLTIINNEKISEIKQNSQQSIENLKKNGNTFFKQNKYWKAIYFYSEALKLIGKNKNIHSKLLLNRSLSYLKLNENNLAYIDANHALKIDSKSVKIRYRYLCTLTNIGKHKKALSIINDIIDAKQNNINSKSIQKEFLTLQNKIQRRYNESIGKYNSISYELMSDEYTNKTVEDYIGNIEIIQIDKIKGRGIIATKDIKHGALILVEKAFSFGSYNNNNDKQTFIQTFNEECNIAYSGRNQELILNTLSKCFCYDYTNYCNYNNFIMNENNGINGIEYILNKWRLLQLFDGNKNEIKSVFKNMIEIFRNNNIFEIMNNNKMKEIKNEIICAKKVHNIIVSNAFETLMKPSNIIHFLDDNINGSNFDVIKNEKYCGCGLWLIGSLFNHSNDSNAQRFVYYKTMFIKAKRNIKKGEEITISYVDQAISSQNDKQKQLQNWGI